MGRSSMLLRYLKNKSVLYIIMILKYEENIVFDCLKCHILKLHSSDFLLLPIMFLFVASISVLCSKTLMWLLALLLEIVA